MNRNAAWRRKMVYLGIIVVMILPLYLLGQPATGSSAGGGGGSLARLQDELNLSVADLGEIDPASESMKLATLGMRGVAATVLWQKSNDYQRYQEWDRLSATLNQIALLQPHFEKVWEYQAHNLSYNVSVEFDDYRQRYKWVKQGTDFLTRGVKLNRREPRLIWYTGWFYGQKLGMSDEKTQFRELFRNDDGFHEEIANRDDLDLDQAKGPDNKPDNWLVGRLWLYRGYDLVDSGVPLINKSPLTFYDIGPKWRIRFADAIEDEGTLDDSAKIAWQEATVDWESFGQRDIETTEGFTIKLGAVTESQLRVADIERQFDELTSNRRDEIRKQRFGELSEEEREAHNTPIEERTFEQQEMVVRTQGKLAASMKEVALELDKDKQLTALRLAQEYEAADRYAKKVQAYRRQTNYPYWEARCIAEQNDRTLQARSLILEANELLDEAELDQALTKFDEAWEAWADVYEQHPLLVSDESADDLMMSIRRYARISDEEDLPDDFPLTVFVEMNSDNNEDADEYAERYAAWKKKHRSDNEPTSEGTSDEKAEADPSASDAKESSEEMKPKGEKADESKPEAEKSDDDVKPEAKKDADDAKPVKDEAADKPSDKPAEKPADDDKDEASGDEPDKEPQSTPADEAKPASEDADDPSSDDNPASEESEGDESEGGESAT
ncbi:MAG: IRE (iron responsive element) [Pirellulaceae bacterium]